MTFFLVSQYGGIFSGKLSFVAANQWKNRSTEKLSSTSESEKNQNWLLTEEKVYSKLILDEMLLSQGMVIIPLEKSKWMLLPWGMTITV